MLLSFIAYCKDSRSLRLYNDSSFAKRAAAAHDFSCVSDLYLCIMGLENDSEKDVRPKKKSFPDLARAAGLK